MTNGSAAAPEREVLELQNQGAGLATISRAEIDMQISTAHAYPRSLEKYQKKAMTMLMLNQETAEECFYVIPRGGKSIEGPSVRLAEIVAASYGNLRAGGRVINTSAEFITGQGLCHDLENNLAITVEVERRITKRDGQRFDADMIGVTGNAAISIALRNAIFRVVPKALWLPLYDQARKVAGGDEKTIEVRRQALLAEFKKMKVSEQMICGIFGVGGMADIGLERIITLRGIYNAIKEGSTTVEEAFAAENSTADIKPAQRKTAEAAPSNEKPKQEETKKGKKTEATREPGDEPTPTSTLATKEEKAKFKSNCMTKLSMGMVDVNKFIRDNYKLENLDNVTIDMLDTIYSDLAAAEKKR
jgi:hypothetical protein